MKGVLLKTEKRSATVMTRDGSFVNISARRGARIGQEVDFIMSKAAKIAVSSVVSLVLLFSLGFGGYTNFIASAHTFITVDINPSVDLELNAIDQVIDVIPNNGDAEVILAQTDLSGMNVSDAISTIAELAVENGYLDPDAENSILVSGTDGSGTDITEKLDAIAEEVKNKLANRSIMATILSEVAGEELKALADEIGVTPGKLLLMEKAVRLDPTLDIETLAQWSIAKITAAIKDAYTQIKAQNREMTIEQALTKNRANSDQLLAQLDRLREKTQSKLQDKGTSSADTSSSYDYGNGDESPAQNGKPAQGQPSQGKGNAAGSGDQTTSDSSAESQSSDGGNGQAQNQNKPDTKNTAGPRG